MENKMEPLKRNKVNVTSTVSPYIAEKMERLVKDDKFSSVSDLVSIAVTEFLVKYEDGAKVAE
jgi:Arc/MetJ-type ribon-helix-helix transcriptional regulator